MILIVDDHSMSGLALKRLLAHQEDRGMCAAFAKYNLCRITVQVASLAFFCRFPEAR